MIDLFGKENASPRASLAMSHASLMLENGTAAEDESARAALFKKHASFKNYPKDHGFYVAKLTLDGIWLISAYGGAAIVQPKNYFAAPDVKAVVPEARELAAAMPTQ